MTDHPDDRLDEVIAAFRRLPVPDPPDPADLLDRMRSDPALPGVDPAAAPDPWRSLLMRPAVRYSTAVAALLTVLGWLALNATPTVALAEVVRATQQHTLARYQVHEVYDYLEHKGVRRTRTAYADLTAPRLRFEERGKTLNEVLAFEGVMVQDNSKDRFLKLISHQQVVTEARADARQLQVIKLVKDKKLANKDAYLYRSTRPDGEPFHLDDLIKGRSLLDSLQELQKDPETRSSRVERAGKEMLIYNLREPARTTTLWVDPQTKLPLRIEAEVVRPYPDVLKLATTYSQFEWDPRGVDPAQLFSTVPPAGFVLKEDRTNAPPAPAPAAAVPKPAGDPQPGGALDQDRPADGPESAAVLKKLDERVPMMFPNETPLVDVLDYIKASTRGPADVGVAFRFDDEGLGRAGRTSRSTITIEEEDESLKVTLPQLLRPLGLTYEVREGILTITSRATRAQPRP